jgi:hypothetical protein
MTDLTREATADEGRLRPSSREGTREKERERERERAMRKKKNENVSLQQTV